MRKSILAVTMAAATIATGTLSAAPAFARDGHGARNREYHRTDNGIRYWRGNDGRNYCRKPNGTTGLLIGGVAGALVGRTIDTRGDRTVGTLLGAAGGALLGREIERGGSRCR